MIAKEFISDTIPFLTLADNAERAMDIMNEFNVTHMAIVDEHQYLSLVSENELLDLEDTYQAFSNIKLPDFKAQVVEDTHIYEAVKLFQEFNLSLLPVVDAQHRYIGCILRDALVKYFASGSQCAENGGIMVLEIDPRNYSLSEIARICESDNVNILSVLTHTNSQNGFLYVTLKTNRQDLNSVVASFERFNYTVLSVFAESFDKETMQDNYKLLMHYINM